MAMVGGGTEGCRPRVLVVEDSRGVRELVLHVLRDRGFEAEGARDGLQAIARLQHGEFDAVVTDLVMPRLDGLALLREIGHLGRRPPVVVHTASLDASTEAYLRRAGAFRVMLKGEPLEDLVRAVEEACAVCGNRPAHCA